MRPSLSIRAAAAVQFFGSLLFVWICGTAWLDTIRLHDFSKPIVLILVFGVPGCFGLLGLVTSIGLLRLREWARQLTLFLATVPVLGCALMILARPASIFPAAGSDEHDALMTVGSGFILVIYLYLLAFLIVISAWWLVLFTRTRIKERFQGK